MISDETLQSFVGLYSSRFSSIYQNELIGWAEDLRDCPSWEILKQCIDHFSELVDTGQLRKRPNSRQIKHEYNKRCNKVRQISKIADNFACSECRGGWLEILIGVSDEGRSIPIKPSALKAFRKVFIAPIPCHCKIGSQANSKLAEPFDDKIRRFAATNSVSLLTGYDLAEKCMKKFKEYVRAEKEVRGPDIRKTHEHTSGEKSVEEVLRREGVFK